MGWGSSGALASAVSAASVWLASRSLLTSTTPTRHRNEQDTTSPALVSRVIIGISLSPAGTRHAAWRCGPAGYGATPRRRPEPAWASAPSRLHGRGRLVSRGGLPANES